jgi:Na+/melibiose symporter-like transporter
MISKALVCIIAIALGLYGAWWASAAAHFFYIESVKSFDELSTTMLAWFVVTAAVLCPALCWSFLKIFKRIRRIR